MEIIIYVALGIVLGAVLLAFLEDLVVGVFKILGYALLAALVIGAIVLGAEFLSFIFSSVLTLITVIMFVGFFVFFYYIERSARITRSRDEKAFREFCSKEKFKDVIRDCLGTSDEDVTLDERAAKFSECAYQLQVRLYNYWIAIDGGESYKLVEAKAERLNEAAHSNRISREIQGARVVTFGQDRYEQPMKEYHFPDRWWS